MMYCIPMAKSLLTDDADIVQSGGSVRRDEEILYASVKRPRFFEVLVDRYTDPFHNKVRGIIGNREEVDDIVQEAFVKIYLNARRFKVQEGASFKSWAYKILINTCLTKAKKLGKERGRTAFDDDP